MRMGLTLSLLRALKFDKSIWLLHKLGTLYEKRINIGLLYNLMNRRNIGCVSARYINRIDIPVDAVKGLIYTCYLTPAFRCLLCAGISFR